MKKDPKIQVYEFESLASFLRAEIYRRKKDGRGFSMQSLSERIGISPSLLTQVLKGKRKLTPNVAEPMADALQLKGRERRYFILLSRRDSVKSQGEKWEIENEMLKLKGKIGESQLSLLQFRLLSEWYYSVLYVAIGMSDGEFVLDSWANRFGGKVSKAKLEEALNDLVSLELVEKIGTGYRQRLGPIATGSDHKQAAAFRYHRQMLTMAEKALELPSNAREFSGLTISLSKKKLGEVKQRVRSFMSELNEFLSESSDKEGIYQLNLQLFPLVDEVLENSHED